MLGLHCCSGFSLVEMNRVYSPAALPLLRFLWSMSSRAHQPPELQLGSSASAQWLGHRGLVAPQHTESSQIRDGTCVSCQQADTLPPSHQGNSHSIWLLFESHKTTWFKTSAFNALILIIMNTAIFRLFSATLFFCSLDFFSMSFLPYFLLSTGLARLFFFSFFFLVFSF